MIETGLEFIKNENLEQLLTKASVYCQNGTLPDYIPHLAQVDPKALAIAIKTISGKTFKYGTQTSFSLMSVVKPFLLLYCLSTLGANSVFQKVDVLPSQLPFNSLEQLKADYGKPRNPMLNSGAIALADLLIGNDPLAKCLNFCDWLNHYAKTNFFLDPILLESVLGTPNLRNLAIAETLHDAGYIESVETAISTYNHLCCLCSNITDLMALGMLLVRCPAPILLEHCRRVKALMMTCGLYQASPRFALTVGLPCKSGVSGAVLAIVPAQGAIAIYSPPLDEEGNSVAGLFILQRLAELYDLSIFS